MPSITTWNRLEPRARSGDMRPGLEARLQDPLWLLARQWQVGEFQGEDVGSPVSVRVRAAVAPIGAPRAAGGELADDGSSMPLEVAVERDRDEPDLRFAAEAGLHLLRLLDDEGVGGYRTAFRDAPAYRLPALPDDVDAAARRYAQLLRGRAPDGRALAAALRTGLPPEITVRVEDRAAVTRAATRFLAWFDDLVRTAPNDVTSWQPERFEHRFAIAADAGGQGVTLNAPEYGGGALDWHAFVHDTDAAPVPVPQAHDVVSTTLPAPAGFAGMPAARYWELEDRQVDLGGVEAAATDLARMLVLDFATTYGNDWFVVPLPLPLGTLTRIRSLVVTDSFGTRWLVPPAGAEPGSDPNRATSWSMYQLTATGSAAAAAGERLPGLLLTPALVAGLESEPVEDVLLIRDEGANLAWAVEHTVEGLAGHRVDRAEAWHRTRHSDASGRPGSPRQLAPLVYRLAGEVPEHWIPLVPEADGVGGTALRVSTFDRLGPDGPVPALPRGRLLYPGRPLVIPEEEVPPEGARVTRAWQYTRGPDGSTHLWSARRKQAGRGPGTSGLAFDLVEPWRPPGSLVHETVDIRVTAGALDPTPRDLHGIGAGETAAVRWVIRNVGAETWLRGGPGALRLGTSDPRDHAGRLVTAGWLESTRPAAPLEPVIEPGQVATLLFEIAAPATPGPFEEAYEPVSEGRGWVKGPALRLTGRVAG
ncbi:hypothetical protein [Modestobacter sp. I12A-02662]|uniref:hypothetical protein n=1 Tax=Modestobacter sp. I12A-02662 TaxID=1730496 RepID=UPI0034DE07A3